MTRARRPHSPFLEKQTHLGRRAALPVVAFALGGTLAAIVQAVAVGAALGAILRGATPARWSLATFAMLALVRAAFAFLGEQAAFAAGAAARRRLRSEALGQLLAVGPSLLRQRHSAELAAIVIDRIEAMEGFFTRWLPAAVLAIAAPMLVLAAVVWLDPWAGLVLGLAGLLVPLAMALSGIGAAVAARRQFQALERLQVRFLDRVRGIGTIVLAGRAADESAALRKAADELRVRTMRVLRMAFMSSAALDLAAAGAIVVLVLRYAALLQAGRPEMAGTAFAVLLLAVEFFAPLRAFAAAYQDRGYARTAAEALGSLPPAPPLVAQLPVRTVQARGVAIAFEDVTLHWDSTRRAALQDVSFRLAAGEMLVLAGPSGSGKSSVIEILLGFVLPDSGRVTLNGADIASIVPEALARLVTWIGQSPVLFAASIEDNIRFGRPEASEAELHDAVAAARLDGLIAELPQGLATRIGEGGYGLSGGQAQRLAIARAFLRNAPLLLLDEPTAHLDPATEAEVLDSLRRLAIGRTVVLASHSAAAHAFSGRRLDLRDGQVVGAAVVARGAA